MPTIKQKEAFDETLENRGNVTKAMREVGYKETTINNPSDLTESNGWKQLMDRHISEEKLAKVHSEGLEATKQEKGLEGEVIDVPDHTVRHKYLDTGYKIRGKIVKEESNVVQAIQVNITNNIKAEEIADEYEEKLKEEFE